MIKILKFGTITEVDGKLLFTDFHIDCDYMPDPRICLLNAAIQRLEEEREAIENLSFKDIKLAK